MSTHQRNPALNIPRIRPTESIVQAEVIDCFLQPVTVEAAFFYVYAPEKFVRLAAVQSKCKADLKNGVPFYRLPVKPRPDFSRRCHAELFKSRADKSYLGINVRQISGISSLLDKCIHAFRERPKELRNFEQLFHEIVVLEGDGIQRLPQPGRVG